MISILRIPSRANDNKALNYWQRLIVSVTLIFILFDISTNEYFEKKIPFSFGKVLQKYRKPQISLIDWSK